MLDGIMAVAVENRPRFRPLSRQARELSDARICYDHLAGHLSVELADFFTTHEYIVFGDEAAEVTEEGSRFLAEFGIDVFAATAKRRHFDSVSRAWNQRHFPLGGARCEPAASTSPP